MAIGIVYALLLSDVDVQLSSRWVNTTLHEILPLVLLADWILLPPWPRASYRKALGWLATGTMAAAVVAMIATW